MDYLWRDKNTGDHAYEPVEGVVKESDYMN